nr:unnamed protein product [Digitaria exilis]
MLSAEQAASREAREDTSERSPCCVAYKEAEASEWNGTYYSGVLRVVVVAAAVVRGVGGEPWPRGERRAWRARAAGDRVACGGSALASHRRMLNC